MPRATRRYKATFVGLGTMGQRHVRAVASLAPRYEIAGAYDVRSDAPVPDGAPRLRTEAEAIASADVLIVATPTDAHAGVVERALAAGKHVLVEKPICATAAEAGALASLSARRGGLLFVGHSERFNPVVRVLSHLLRGDAVLTLDLQRVGPSRPADCGVLVNLGVHDFDLAAYLVRSPVSVRAAVGTRTAGNAGEDSAHVLFTTATGAAGHLWVDRTVSVKRRQILLATPRWLYEGDLLNPRLVRTARATGSRSDVPLPLGEPLASQALALADALEGADPREIATADDGARAVALAERAAALVAVEGWPAAPSEPTGEHSGSAGA